MNEDNYGVNHLAVIMDGNGRWAQSRGLERTQGHQAGAETVFKLLEAAQKFHIHYLTLYAFSTENWTRPVAEVNALMKLLQDFLFKYLPTLQKKDIKLNAIGRLEQLPAAARQSLLAAMKSTRDNRSGVLTLALNYGGRAELTDAAVRLARAVQRGELAPEDIDEKQMTKYLYDPELPDPELMIRTSGELRISNFLLWQLAYSELYITDVMWPDFDENELRKALESFGKRSRRFGAVSVK